METRVLSFTASPDEAVAEAVRLLRAGEVVALPTETVYGLGANALDPHACARIFEAKDRPWFDPLIVHLPHRGWLSRLTLSNPLAERLADAFWPGPLTLVLPRTDLIPDLVTSGEPTVAVRWSKQPVFQAVAQALDAPIAAPSANRFGRISPTTANHVYAELHDRISLILDGGPCEHGVESTIVAVKPEGLVILRHGPITPDDLAPFAAILSPEAISAPGQMKSHYAPTTPVTLVSTGAIPAAPTAGRWGLLRWQSPLPATGWAAALSLSPGGNLREAATHLYGHLRQLDDLGLDGIFVELVPELGLGLAINERLRKAAARE